MLEEDESKRLSSLDLVLSLNTQQNILRQILVPHGKTFHPSIEPINAGYRVSYDVKRIIYEGELNLETLEKDGLGVIYKNDDKLY
jgi:hypothetical protein